MPSFTTRLAAGWERGLEDWPLAIVPLVTALLATEKIHRILGFQGGHVGLRLGLPVGIVDLWQFVSVPNESVSVGLPLPDALAVAAVVLPIAVVVRAALAAGYFGSLATTLETGGFDFLENSRRHFVPFLAYTAIPVVAIAPLVLLGLAGRRMLVPVIVLLVPALVAAAYLFYATPYLIVLRGDGLVSALQDSYALAVDGGPYFRYAVGYAGFVLATSLVATAVVVNLGIVGVLVGVVAAAPVGLACNTATMRFVADIDPESPSLGTWPDEATAAP